MTPDGTAILQALMPELILTGGAMLILMTGLLRGGAGHAASTLAMLVIAGALIWTVETRGGAADFIAGGMLRGDALVWVARTTTFSVGLLILMACRGVPEPRERAEFFSLLLLSLAGISLVAVANDLVLLFLALELVSVPTYVLIGLSRRDVRAQEATGKYFFLGAFAAAVTLYGFSFLYGGAGTMRLYSDGGAAASISAWMELPSRGADKFLVLGLLLSLAGLTFKLAAVPLHFYVADVYQGAASPVTGMLGFVPKFAGFLAMIRLLAMTGWIFGNGLFWLLWATAAATMTVGNTLALMQQNVKRMLAYSSVAHSGYMLVALLAASGIAGGREAAGPLSDGIAALLFYISIYAVMNLGAFAAISFFRKAGEDEEDSVETLDELAGAARRHPWACLGLAICVLGLMGMPPAGGFFGKLYVFSAALGAPMEASRHTAMIWLVVIGVLNAAVAAAYYLRILAACYLRPAGAEGRGVAGSADGALRACLAVCAILVLLTFARPSVLMNRSEPSKDGRGGGSWHAEGSQKEPARSIGGRVEAADDIMNSP